MLLWSMVMSLLVPYTIMISTPCMFFVSSMLGAKSFASHSVSIYSPEQPVLVPRTDTGHASCTHMLPFASALCHSTVGLTASPCARTQAMSVTCHDLSS